MYQETIDLSHLPPEGLRLERRVHPNAWKITESDWESKGDLLFELFLQGGVARTTVTGSLIATVAANCHRCLKPIEMPLKRSFHLTYLPVDAERLAKEEVELESDDLDMSYLDKMFLPLDELIREQVYLALPMKVLCTPDCPGLCPHCGADLNEVECACSEEQVDPRWASLKAINNRPS